MADGSRILVVAIGVCNLCFESRVLILEDCLYVPNVRRNLISATYLGKHGYCVILKDNAVIKKGKMFICSGNIVYGLYILTPDKHVLYNYELNNDSHVKSLKKKFPSTSDAYLWHLRLGHINSNRIQRLIKDGLLEPMDFVEFPVCESCLEGKMTKRLFNAKGRSVQDLLELVHSDVCGPLSIQARGGYEYFITFTDDYTRFGYVYLMKRKSEAFEKFKEFMAKVENQLGKRIKAIRSDRGGEYLLGDFKDYLIENGIVSQMTAPRTSQQNGVSERRNRALLETVRSMMSYSTLLISFWGYALNTTMYLLNLVPSKSVPKTLVEMWNGRKPSIRDLHIWGCPTHVLKGKSDKLQSKTKIVFFVGYPKGTFRGLFYSHKDNKVFVSTNAKFLENDYMNNYTPRSRVALAKMNEPINKQLMDETRDDVALLDTS